MDQLPIPKHIWVSLVLPKLSLKDYIRCSTVCRYWRAIAVENEKDLHRLPWLMLSQNEQTRTGLFYSLPERKTYKLNLTELASKSYCSGSTEGNLVLSDGAANFVFNPFSQHTTSLPPHYVPLCYTSQLQKHRQFFYKKSVVSVSSANRSQLLVASLCSVDLIIVTCSSHHKEWSVFGTENCSYVLKPTLRFGLMLLPPKEEEHAEEKEEYNDGEEEYSDGEQNGEEHNEEEEEEECNDWEQNGEHNEEEEEEKEYNEEEEENQEEHNEEKEEEEEPKDFTRWMFEDIMFYKGVLHGLSYKLTLVRLKPDASLHQVEDLVELEKPVPGPTSSKGYLVESTSGELLMVYRNCHLDPMNQLRYITEGFFVYKLDDQSESGGVLRWVEVKSLGDEIIFLGRNSSICVSAKGIPGFKGNCIYFTDDGCDMWSGASFHETMYFSDNGVFDLEDGQIHSFFPPGFRRLFKSPPIWVMPNKLEVAH